MRMSDITRYFDTDAVSNQLEKLQTRISELRELVPYTAQKKRGYALPTALMLGGIAAIGAIAITSLVVREMNNAQYPEQPDHES